MRLTRTYKFRLYRTDKNKHLIQQIDIAGIIYNHCVALHRKYYRLTGKHLNRFALANHIVKLKKLPKHEFWRKVGSQAIQDVVERIDRAYSLFFRNLKASIKTAPPGFKKVKKYSSFTLKQAGWKLLDNNRIRIQGRNYKFAKSRDIPDCVKTVTIKRDKLGNLWLYFVCQEDVQPNAAMSGKMAGFDFGLKTFLAGSDGTEIESPLFARQARVQIRKAHRSLSGKRKGSGGWYKAKDALNRVYQGIANRRTDWFFKLAHELTDKYDVIFMEDLNLKAMSKLWGKKIADLARSEFVSILQHIASTKNKIVHFVGRFFPSSKTCSCCGHVYKELSLSERHWVCAKCGTLHDRDHNAAVNIHREGASSLSETTVRPGLFSGQSSLVALESNGI